MNGNLKLYVCRLQEGSEETFKSSPGTNEETEAVEGKQLTRGFTSSKWQSLVPGARPRTTGPAPSLVPTRLCSGPWLLHVNRCVPESSWSRKVQDLLGSTHFNRYFLQDFSGPFMCHCVSRV